MPFQTAFRKAHALTISALLLTSPTPSHADIRHVGNGGGASEQMLLYAFDRLPHLLETCKASISCAQTSDEESLLDALIQSHASEVTQGGLKFPVPWTQAKDMLFATEARVGSSIEINVERLYDVVTGYRVPALLPDSIEIVMGALAKHHPQIETDKARGLAKRAGRIWESQIRNVNLASIAHPEISLMTVRSTTEPFSMAILIGFGEGFSNISSAIAADLPCPLGQKVRELSLSNLYWSSPENDGSRNSILLRANASLRFVCGTETNAGLTHDIRGTTILEFKTSVKNGTAHAFLKDPSKFELVPLSEKPKVMLFDLH